MKKRCLISVSNKEKVVWLAGELQKLDYEIISTSGTAKFLKQNGIKIREVSDLTGFPEILGGRIKTLHPKIHAGLLALKNNQKHLKELKQNNIELIDILIVNLYPFEETVSCKGSLGEIIENIDIGGPAMIRAAAKNYRFTAVVVDPRDYKMLIIELKKGELGLKTKQKLALKAFRLTAFYDSIITQTLQEKFSLQTKAKKFQELISIPLRKKTFLRYGENPHQSAALYLSPLENGLNLAQSEILHGKEMSFNNFLDAEAALHIIKEFKKTGVVIVKHQNPCGVALNNNLEKAYSLVLSSDPKSAFGGIVSLNRKVDQKTAEALIKIFLELIIAPDYDDKALTILKSKKNLRIIKVKNFSKEFSDLEYRKISGGWLLQDKDKGLFNELKIVTKKKPTKKEMEDLLFAFKVVKHVKSNAIVIAKNRQTIGIGSGQTSRVDSLFIAIKKAKEFGFSLKGSVLASEAFFPFKDSIELAAKHGIKAVIQPGGSVADKEVIEAADKYKIAMVFTAMRHFKH